MQKKVECAEIGQLESLHFTFTNTSKMFFHSLSSDLANKDGIVLIAQSDQSDIRCIAFVTRPSVRKFC